MSGHPQKKSRKQHGSQAKSTMSRMLNKLGPDPDADWTEEDNDLWSEYVQSHRTAEMQVMCLEGKSEKEAERLTPIAWAKLNSGSGDIDIDRLPPKDSSSSVPVFLVHKDGDFKVHWMINGYLIYHPKLRNSRKEPPKWDEKAYVLNVLHRVNSICTLNGLEDVNVNTVYNALPEHARVERRILDCAYASQELENLINPKYLERNEDENTDWLLRAISERRFWKLLKMAVCIGEALECHRILDLEKGEAAIQSVVTTPPGKNPGGVGNLFEQLVETYALEKRSSPTPLKLLKWLGSGIENHADTPLKIDHSLWPREMTEIRPQGFTLEQFKQYVKDAKKRIKKR